MPYMEAFISEVQRHGSLTPLSVPHAAVNDTEFRGYKIKRNTPVNANLVILISLAIVYLLHFSYYHLLYFQYEIMRDPKNFENPDKFCPERFLDPVTGKYHVPRGYVPFSVGKRECLGRALAKMELFFFTTSLLQQFK